MKRSYQHTRRACYIGYISQAAVNNLAPILFVVFQRQFSLSYEHISWLILLNFGTQLAVDMLSVQFLDRIGYRAAAILSHALAAAGLLMLGLLPLLVSSPFWGLVPAVVLYALGGGMIEVLVSPLVEALPGNRKAADMSLLHSFYCWGQVAVVLASTLLVRLIGEERWFLLPILWALVPLGNLLFFRKVPLPALNGEETGPSLRQLFSSRFFLLALLLMTCAGAAEITMSQWSSLFAERALGIDKVMGDLLGPCLFALLMGVGRTAFGLWGNRLPLQKLLLGSALFCAACYAITAFVPSPALSLLGCAFCGLSVSLMWPGLYSYSAARFPAGGTTMFGMLALFGDIGCSLGPWLAGMVSELSQNGGLSAFAANNGLTPEQAGLKAGMAAVLLFPLTMAAGLLLSLCRSYRRRHSEYSG